MSDGQEFTVYETEGQQPVTVTVNQNGEDLQQIQYITQDGTVVSAGQIVAGGGNVIQVADGVQGISAQPAGQQLILNQATTQPQAQPVSTQPKKKKYIYPAESNSNANSRFVWARFRGVPCWWPARVISGDQIYVKCDNALKIIVHTTADAVLNFSITFCLHSLCHLSGNRPVPVLIPADTQKSLDYIASRTARREAGIPEDNRYLFPNSGQSHARAYSSLKNLCDECLLAYPGRITSVSLRKYTATLTQMLNLDQYQIDWVCRHLGHSSDVHKAHYRQMSGLVERVYVTKMLLLQDMNLTKKFKGKSLDEIDLTEMLFPDSELGKLEDNEDVLLNAVVGDMARNERDDEPVDRVVFEDDNDGEQDDMESEEEEEPPRQRNICKKKVVRQRWDQTEVEEIHKYFQSYLDAKVTPRANEVTAAKKKSKSNEGKLWKRSNDKIVKKISAMNHKK